MNRIDRTLTWIENHDVTVFLYGFAALLTATILGF